MSRVYAAEYCVYKILESILKHRGYGSLVEMLQGMIPFYSIGSMVGKRVFKYHIVITYWNYIVVFLT
jgi:hypothetical protein